MLVRLYEGYLRTNDERPKSHDFVQHFKSKLIQNLSLKMHITYMPRQH